MAQDFRNVKQDNLPTSHHDTNSLLWTGGDFDAIIGIRIANITTGVVTVDIYIRNSSVDYYLVKGLSIPPNSSVELIQGGAKVVLVNGDVLYGIADTGNATDVIVSGIDTISA